MARFQLRCSECSRVFSEDPDLLVCPHCFKQQQRAASLRGVLEIDILEPPADRPLSPMLDEGFLRAAWPLGEADILAPLPVGNTPLLEVSRLRTELSMPRLWLKDDTRNPSGSSKDRASLLVAAKARGYGRATIATASTGNAATALAAICAASGQRAVVLVPADAPPAKLVQMLSYGATVAPVAGSYDQAFELCVQACEEFGWYNRNTAQNPFTLEGKKTLAVEIAAQLAPETPDVVVVPTGDGVILGGIAKGFADLAAWGLLDGVPRLIAVQPEGASALSVAFEAGADDVETVAGARSVADSLVVEAPRNARLALRRLRQSRGAALAVSDEAIVASISRLASLTGVFVEPAAAAGLAGLEKALREGLVNSDERVVLLATGSGLKDREAAARSVTMPNPVEPTLEGLTRRLTSEHNAPRPS